VKVQNSDSSQVETETSQVGVSTPNLGAQSVSDSIRTGEKLASWSEAEAAKPNNTLSIDEIATLGRNFLNHVNGKAG
jgi:hypothetical protein